MSVIKRDTDKQTRQLSIDRAQLELEQKRCIAHSDKLVSDKKALQGKKKQLNMSMSTAKNAMAVETNVGLLLGSFAQVLFLSTHDSLIPLPP